MAIFTPRELMDMMKARAAIPPPIQVSEPSPEYPSPQFYQPPAPPMPILERIAATRDVLIERTAPPPVEKITVALPFPIWTPFTGIIRPEVTITPERELLIEPKVGFFEAFAPTEPGPREIIQPITILGALEPEYGEDIPEEIKEEYIEAIADVPKVPGMLIPAFEFPEFKFPDVLGGLKDVGKYALIAGGLILAAYLFTRKK